MFDKAQWMRGNLEACLLKMIEKEDVYGYVIVEKLKEFGFESISEGSIYPILLRLEKQKYIHSYYINSELGPKRKYYHITQLGKDYLIEFYDFYKHWSIALKELFEEEFQHEKIL